MAESHVIRLRGPWEYQPLAVWTRGPDGQLHEQPAEQVQMPPGQRAARVEMPSDWGATLGRNFRGRVRYVRRFGAPTGLDPSEQVWLVLHGIDARGHVELNEQAIGQIATETMPARFEITPLLKTRNVLAVVVELPPAADESARGPRAGQPGGLIGEVCLEIAHRVDGPLMDNV